MPKCPPGGVLVKMLASGGMLPQQELFLRILAKVDQSQPCQPVFQFMLIDIDSCLSSLP